MQLRSCFGRFDTPYPLVMHRNSRFYGDRCSSHELRRNDH